MVYCGIQSGGTFALWLIIRCEEKCSSGQAACSSLAQRCRCMVDACKEYSDQGWPLLVLDVRIQRLPGEWRHLAAVGRRRLYGVWNMLRRLLTKPNHH
jgi:hypothetical protein